MSATVGSSGKPSNGHAPAACNRCRLADPDWPFRYSASLAKRLPIVPPWWEAFTSFVAARHHPGRAAQVLRALGAVLTADPSRTSPQQLVQRLANGNDAPDALLRALTAFFTEAGLALPPDDSRRRADKRRQGYLDAVPVSFQPAVVAFNQNLLSERDRARRSVPGRSATSPWRTSCGSCVTSPST